MRRRESMLVVKEIANICKQIKKDNRSLAKFGEKNRRNGIHVSDRRGGNTHMVKILVAQGSSSRLDEKEMKDVELKIAIADVQSRTSSLQLSRW